MISLFEATKAFCDSLLSYGLPGFDLIVYHQGSCVLRYSNGYRDLENKLPITGKERLNLYSCSKPITCTVAMQLWEQGLFDLEDPIAKYLPEFQDMDVLTEHGPVKAKNPILIRHLFQMTSGLSYDVNSPQMQLCRQATNGGCPGREMVRYLAKEPLLFEPGTQWKYSLSHDVLAVLVEVLTGQPFEDYVKQHIFAPLGMEQSTFLLPAEELDTIAPQYNYQNKQVVQIGKETSTYRLGHQHASGGAGCISTVDDYIKFVEALRKGQLLKPETIALMTTDQMTETHMRTYFLRETHGYGLGVRCGNGDPRNSDFGWDGAACSYMSLDMENQISIFFGAHLRNPPVQDTRNLLHRFIRAELIEPEDIPQVQAIAKERLGKL